MIWKTLWPWMGPRKFPRRSAGDQSVIILVLVLSGSLSAAAQETSAPAGDTAAAGEPPAAAATPEASSPEASSPEALSAYAQAATLQNNGAFDLAADAWQNFLRAFPQDPKAIEAEYHLGVCYLELKDFVKARQQLERAIATGQDFPRREDAYLNLGWTCYTLALQGNPALFANAEQAFAKLLESFPEGQYRDQALFLRGESLYLQGQRPEAALAYQQLIDQYPKSDLIGNGLYALGVTYEELGRFAEAGVIYDRYLAELPDETLANEVRMRKAETVLQQGDPAAAERQFAELAQRSEFSQADHARYREAFCVARQERFEDAARLFSSIPNEFPESRYVTDATMAAARAYFRAEKLDLAKQWFAKLLNDESPLASEAAHWQARLLLKDKAAPAALQLIEKFLPIAQRSEHPFFVNLRLDQADAVYEIPERRAESIPLYLALADEFPTHVLAPQAVYNAAFAALETKDYRRGLSLANQFVAKYPDHRLLADVKHVAAECQLQLGDAASAADTFSELAEQNEDRPEAGQWHLRQAVALYLQKDYLRAALQLTGNMSTLATPEERAEAYYLIGMSHFGLEDFARAAESLAKSLEIQPRWRQADETLLNLSRAQRKLDQVKAAQASVERLIREFPESKVLDQAHFRLAEYTYALGDLATAADHYRQLTERWPQSSFIPYALYGLGWSELRLEHKGPAQEAFRQLLARFPEHPLVPQAQYALALSLQQAGSFAEALAIIDAYLQRDLKPQEQSDGRYVMGLSFVGTKEYPRAIQVLQQVVEQDPDYASIDKVLYELAWAYKSTQQQPESVATFRKLADDHPNSSLAAEASYHVGEDAYEREDYTAATAAYERALAGQQGNGDLDEKVRYKLGWSAYQLQNYELALQVFAEQIAQHPAGELAGDAHFMQGECYLKAQNPAEALAQYRLARELPLSSEQIITLNFLHAGQVAGQLGQWKESYDWLAALSEKFPQSAFVLQIAYELAVAQQNLGNLAEAERLFGSVADRANGETAARAALCSARCCTPNAITSRPFVNFAK